MSHYLREDDLHRLVVAADSPLVGTPRGALELQGVTLVGVLRDGSPGPLGDEPVQAGDTLIVQGDDIAGLADEQRLAISGGDDDLELITRELGAAEIVLPPRSALIGESVFPGMVTASGDLVVLAVQRAGEDQEGEVELAAGRHAAGPRHLGRAGTQRG